MYLQHLALLMCSMHIFLGDRISLESLSVVEYVLDKFYRQFEELHGKLALYNEYTYIVPAYTYYYFFTMHGQASKTAP